MNLNLVTDDIATLLLRAAAHDRAAPALTFYRGRQVEGSLRYGELVVETERAAATLLRLGVKPEDRVAVAAANELALPVWLLALWRIGAVAVPLDPSSSSRQWRHALDDSGARGILVADALASVVPAAGLRFVHPFGAGFGAPPATPPLLPLRSGEAPALISYTSGTTGLPKGVTLSQRNLVANATAVAARFRLRRATQLAVLPLHHAHALGFGLLSSLVSSGHLVLADRFDPITWPYLVRAHAATWASVTPHLLPFLEHVGVHHDDVPSLRGLLVSSAPLPTDVARRFEDTTELPLVHGWSLSEFTNFACCTDPFATAEERSTLLYDDDVPSVGAPLDGVEVTVRGEWGERRTEGERGELCVRGRSRMIGYYDDLAGTERALYGDWLRTGDQGYFRVRDGRARFYVSGRLEEIVVRGRQKSSPIAVENRLLADVPELSGHVVVLGFPHRVQGEELGAYVELDALTETVTARLVGAIERLPDGERPKVILHGTQPIPRTQGGKVQRALLQALFENYDDCGAGTRVERVCYD